MARIFVLSLIFALSGCASEIVYVDRPVKVLVPVPVARKVPTELEARFMPDHLPKFTDTSDELAVVALTEENLTRLKALLRTLTVRDAAWRAWATEGVDHE